MKKNRTMRAAALLLALTLMTSCFVGGTFAKYTTSVEGSDTARVAYWGFGADDPTTVTFDLFKAPASETGLEVIDGVNLLAPGTSGSAQFAFVNAKSNAEAPEVDYKVTISTEGSSSSADIGALEAELVWTLDGTTYDTLDLLLAAVKALSGEDDGEATYEAGTAVPAGLASGATHTIGWSWEFYENEDGDKADTALGNAATLEEVTVAISIVVEQVN